jgi:hypothetical protein
MKAGLIELEDRLLEHDRDAKTTRNTIDDLERMQRSLSIASREEFRK